MGRYDGSQGFSLCYGFPYQNSGHYGVRKSQLDPVIINLFKRNLVLFIFIPIFFLSSKYQNIFLIHRDHSQLSTESNSWDQLNFEENRSCKRSSYTFVSQFFPNLPGKRVSISSLSSLPASLPVILTRQYRNSAKATKRHLIFKEGRV